MEQTIDDALIQEMADRKLCIDARKDLLNPRKCRDKGVQTNAWTLNKPEQAEKLIDWVLTTLPPIFWSKRTQEGVTESMRIYENPQKTSENRKAARSYYIPGGVSEYLLLNGKWNFAYFERDIDVPEKIEKWDTIEVPSCWQILGYENPNYTNTNYPYPVDQPYVPDDNPCGVYQRTFEIEKKWGKLYFVLEGVSSCAFVSVNGTYVGFTQGSHLQAEFDITDMAVEGINTITVKVLKWCCGSYLEDQDFFRFNGIFRDCCILQRPFDHVDDFEIIPNDKCIDIKLDKCANIRIFDGETLLAEGFGDRFSHVVENPILWNAEKPYLYRVELERNGEIISRKIGLLKVEISENYELLINGVSVKLFGVNHHDTSKYRGWCQSDEELRADLLLMKDLNFSFLLGDLLHLSFLSLVHFSDSRAGKSGLKFDSEGWDDTLFVPAFSIGYKAEFYILRIFPMV